MLRTGYLAPTYSRVSKESTSVELKIKQKKCQLRWNLKNNRAGTSFTAHTVISIPMFFCTLGAHGMYFYSTSAQERSRTFLSPKYSWAELMGIYALGSAFSATKSGSWKLAFSEQEVFDCCISISDLVWWIIHLTYSLSMNPIYRLYYGSWESVARYRLTCSVKIRASYRVIWYNFIWTIIAILLMIFVCIRFTNIILN